jgi:hypothetical protein
MDKKLAKNSEHPNLNVGRKPGVPNKSTKTAREAFALLVEGNVPKMQEWLEKVAEGIPMTDKEGNPIEKDGVIVYRVQPSPKDAIDLVQKIAEYHVPKLARTEVVGDEKAPQRMVVTWKK